MRATVVIASLALLLPSCRKREAQSVAAGDLEVELSIDPDPPSAGANTLRVVVHDAAGKPIEGARVGFIYDMPAMGSMPEMKGGGETRALGSGKYDVAYSLPMLGDWSLTVGIEAPGHPPAEIRLKISPPRKGFVVERRGGAGKGAASPAKATQANAGKEMDVPPERQQLIGVTYATVEERPLSVSMRAAGHIEVDERDLAEVNLKYEAYVRKLFVAETGKRVKAGDPLLRIYSPDLLAAEQELLQLRRSGEAPGSAELLQATTRRLQLLDLTPAQIAAIERRGSADGILLIVAPATGVVLEKNVVEGTHAMPGTTLYRIGNLGRIWVQAELYESDAPLVSVGQMATVSLPSLSGTALHGRVSFVAPTVDLKTRTVQARIELQNPGLVLKPGMFADVRVEAPLGTRLAVPDSALLLSGEHRYAFVQRGEGKLQPVEVQVGALTGDYDEVRAGLSKGDRVVLGANFLVASEAQLRDALPRWEAR